MISFIALKKIFLQRVRYERENVNRILKGIYIFSILSVTGIYGIDVQYGISCCGKLSSI